METLDKILYQLKTIARIQKNAKISTDKEFIVVESASVFQWLYRWNANESRNKALNKITEIISTAICLSTIMMEVPGEIHLSNIKKIKERLMYARHGVENLCETYRDDADFIGKIRPTVSKIILHLEKMDEYLDKLGTVD